MISMLTVCRIVIQMQFAFRLPRLFSVSGSNLRKITRFCISKTNLHQTQMDLALCLRAWYNKYLDQVLMRKGEAESSDDK
ncbi:hypothetical protein C5167_042583 [Papaver somniferum]|uniref:Uncharacterized protein n=1 Tax=Papaver somniferum TaxID=3469 RepID=A0A4Y7L497_PAPSO|nr:hypothetical protein C5167_042583 [Papaver somniferum]